LIKLWLVALIIATVGSASGDSGLSAMARLMENLVGKVAGLAVGGNVGLAIYGAITGGISLAIAAS
jgi:hypothetical protein